MSQKVFVIGVGMTKFEKPGCWDGWDYPDMAREPGTMALADDYLASEKCSATGQVYAVQGGAISALSGWHDTETIETDGVWQIDDIAARLPGV